MVTSKTAENMMNAAWYNFHHEYFKYKYIYSQGNAHWQSKHTDSHIVYILVIHVKSIYAWKNNFWMWIKVYFEVIKFLKD